jgi:hypothetical protein
MAGRLPSINRAWSRIKPCWWKTSGNRSGCGEKRFYDFTVRSERKNVEKLRYMHRNPVQHAQVTQPDHWMSNSFRAYAYGENVHLRVNVKSGVKDQAEETRDVWEIVGCVLTPLNRKVRD